MENQWLLIAEWLDLIAAKKILEWKCEFPPDDVLPSDKLDKCVSAWCKIMARNMTASIYPPEEVRPWILARLVSCSFKAKQEAEGSNSWPDVTKKTILKAMLVDQWNNELKQKWILTPEGGSLDGERRPAQTPQ
ncbi:MAG: hypothetical protein JWM59_1860 [Verrucomicrobiales bacterium]|nr:hypothetical protein [Verrucomicrobiales bacterium]